jgi:hypothetical protein
MQLPVWLRIVCILAAPAIVGGLTVFVWGGIHSKRRRRIQDEILRANSELMNTGSWFRANYVSESKLRHPTRKQLMESFLWEASGILLITGSEAVFLGRSVSSLGELSLRFSPEHSRATWVGAPWTFPQKFMQRLLFPTTFLTRWLQIDCQREKHYFTSENGRTVFASMAMTRRIYDELSNVLGSVDP